MKEDNDDIQQRPEAECEGLEAWNEMPHPQDDLPVEVVTMYVVKDYRRMYNAFERYRKMAMMNIRHIENRALAIASRCKSGTKELTELKLQVEDKDRKINEMYDWLQQKDSMIASLCWHCTRQRDQIAVNEKNLAAQRQQIQSLLSHIGGDGDGKDVLASCDASWNVERWKKAMVNIDAVRQQLGELMEAVGLQELDEGVRQSLTGILRIIRSQTRRAYNSTASIASKVLRKEFGAEIIPHDDGDQEQTDE